jgi:hypothetical protein
VNTAAQDLERLPAVERPSDVNTDGEVQAADMGTTADEAPDGALIDRTSTASIEPDDAMTAYDAAIQPPSDAGRAIDAIIQPADEEGTSVEMASAHLEWCFSHYRSYRPEDDSYTSYSGESRRCESPYSGAGAESAELSASAQTAGYRAGAEGQGVAMTIGHVEDCFSRYRSYRAEDNTYQPYGGGPRKQCL